MLHTFISIVPTGLWTTYVNWLPSDDYAVHGARGGESAGNFVRGLKPTATVIASLRDERPLVRTEQNQTVSAPVDFPPAARFFVGQPGSTEDPPEPVEHGSPHAEAKRSSSRKQP